MYVHQTINLKDKISHRRETKIGRVWIYGV